MELALVVGTIGILAALAISGVGRYRERALKASAIATMRTIATNLSGMLAATGRLPDSLAEIEGKAQGSGPRCVDGTCYL